MELATALELITWPVFHSVTNLRIKHLLLLTWAVSTTDCINTVCTDCEGSIIESWVGSCMSPPPAEEVEAAARFCCMPWSNPGSSVELVSPLAAAACCRAAWEGHKHRKCDQHKYTCEGSPNWVWLNHLQMMGLTHNLAASQWKGPMCSEYTQYSQTTCVF